MDGEAKARFRMEELPFYQRGYVCAHWPPVYREGTLLRAYTWEYLYGIRTDETFVIHALGGRHDRPTWPR